MDNNEATKRMITSGMCKRTPWPSKDDAGDILALMRTYAIRTRNNISARQELSTLDTWDQDKKQRIMELLGG